MTESSSYDVPLPPVAQPRGVAYLLGTWCGRILLVNTAVFLVLCVMSGSLFMPDTQTLLAIGAKDPVALARGEVWRLVTPMFIHIGLLHFAVNSFVLYLIGYQLERVLGGGWFVAIYLASGIAGNVASAVFNVHMSAGASGAIFGLLGCGFYLERAIGSKIEKDTGQRPQNRVYAMTVALNLAFGFMVPFVDNAAHVGGLVTGAGLTFAMVNLRPNRLRVPVRKLGFAVIGGLAALILGGSVLAVNPSYVKGELVEAATETDSGEQKLYYLTQAVSLAPNDLSLRLKRARLLFLAGDSKFAFFDVRRVIEDPGLHEKVESLAKELEQTGMSQEAWQLRRLLEHHEQEGKM